MCVIVEGGQGPKKKCISRESNTRPIDDNDGFCH